MTAEADTLDRNAQTEARETARVLSTAVSHVAENWQLTNDGLGRIIGVSPATAQRLRAGNWKLERGKKPFELAQYLVRLFRSLDSIMGSDDAASISWLQAYNLDLNNRPIELIETIGGLVAVADYIDGYRAKV